MVKEEPGFSFSCVVIQDIPLFRRSIPKTRIGERRHTELIKQEENDYLYDIGCEDVGYLSFKVNSGNKQIQKRFFVSEKGLYVNNSNTDTFSELVNSLAVVCGAATGETVRKICDILAEENDLTGISLSMCCFKYDAMLGVDEGKYAPYVIASIEKIYGKMLSAGATSFWEDYDGADAFDKAGSLCHGWSAMPVYYLYRLRKYL